MKKLRLNLFWFYVLLFTPIVPMLYVIFEKVSLDRNLFLVYLFLSVFVYAPVIKYFRLKELGYEVKPWRLLFGLTIIKYSKEMYFGRSSKGRRIAHSQQVE